jgi:tight adherence protein B
VTPALIALLVFLAVACGFFAMLMVIRDLAANRRAKKKDDKPAIRLRRLAKPEREGGPKGPVGKFDNWFAHTIQGSGLSLDPTSGALLVVLCTIAGGGIFYLLWEQAAPVMFGCMLGMAIPLFYFMRRYRKRTKQLQGQLPSALDMLARDVLSGHSIDQGITTVGDNSPEPLATEFRYCAKQMSMGLSLPAVMRSLVNRVGLNDIRIFTTSLSIHRQTGGNVAQVLHRLANVVRDRMSYRRQLRVATSAGRLSAVVVGLAAPLLFVFFLTFRSEYLSEMIKSPLGQSLLIIALVLEVIGIVWITRLLKPAY